VPHRRTIILALGAESAAVETGEAGPGATVIGAADVPRLVRRPPGPRIERLVVVGRPPWAEIGYGLVTMLALALRPRHVELVDADSGSVDTYGLAGYLVRSAPAAGAQLAVGAPAVAGQRLIATALRRPGGPSQTRGRELERVLYVRAVAGATTHVGGAVTHTHEVIRALRNAGVEVDALTTDGRIAEAAAADPDSPCRWRVVGIPRVFKAIPASTALGGDLQLVRVGLRAAKRADVIYQRHGRFSLAGALLSRLSGTPLFLEFNGTETFFHQHWQRVPLAGQLKTCEDAVLDAAARIIVVSEVDRRELIKRGHASRRIVVNPNGVDSSRFARGGGGAARAALGLTDGQIVVGFLGSFGPWHGGPLLAEAFTRAAAEVAELRLLLIGDGDERPRTEHLLAEGGVADRALSVGSVAGGDVPRLLDACDILAASHVRLPGGVEFFGSPTKLFEYMAAGKAIAASRLGQIGEVLEHERTALLVEPGDAPDLADALVRLARDPALRSRLGRAARAAAIERHGWSNNAERLIEAYLELRRAG
jgi:glycosyltransferase involved in cell wall biosynthesis